MRIRFLVPALALAVPSYETSPVHLEALPAPPVAEIKPRVTEIHGDRLVDDYYWLRDREDPAVIAYLEAENEYTAAVMGHTEALQEDLYEELVGRLKETDFSVPERRGKYLYYYRTEEGKQYRIYCRKPAAADDGPEGPEEVILDVNALAAGHDFFELGAFEPSPDHRLLAFSTDTDGAERYTVRVKDLESGRMLADEIPNTAYSLEWAADNRTLFYTVRDEVTRPFKVLRHRLGTDAGEDPVVFHEPDERFYVGVAKTRDDRYLLIELGSSVTTEVHYLDAARPGESFTLLRPRVHEVRYYVGHHGDHFYLRTNAGAKNFKLMRLPVGSAAEDWQEVVAHRERVKLERHLLFAGHMVLVERQAGMRTLRVRDLATGAERLIDFPEPAYQVRPARNPEFDTTTFRYSYTSMVTPRSIFDYDMVTAGSELKKQTEVLGGYDPALYVAERIFARAGDGMAVPILLLYKRGLERDGSNPCLLYGYGSYGATIDAGFRSHRLSLVDRGFVYAIANIRGGGVFGDAWHDDGKMLRKRNTFTDFIAAAEHLIARGYAARDRLAIRGGSAGGLLMGAVANLRPDLFAAVIADVPFVDVLTTMLDESIPLTVTEWEEWGNPRIEEQYRYMRSYSPYDNVAALDYPDMLILGGLNDTRVLFHEPAKWVAKLRAHKTGDRKLLLKIDMGAGHGGASGRYDALRDRAFEYAFVLDSVGSANGL